MSLLRNIDKFLRWDAEKKQFVPYYWRRNVLPSWLGYDPADLNQVNGLVTVNAAGVMTPPVSFQQPYWSVNGADEGVGTPFEVRSLVYASHSTGAPPFAENTATANYTVVMQEVGQARQFMNNPVHIRCLAGTAQLPALLREPYYMQSKHSLSVQFAKVAGAAVGVRFYLVGAQFYPWDPEFRQYPNNKKALLTLLRRWEKRKQYVSPYWLVPEQNVNLLANATGNFFLKVGDDGHFEGFTITAVSTGNFGWELSEPKTQQTIMNGQVTQTNGVGTALFPTLLPTPYLVPAGYRLRLTITDLSGAPNQVFFTIAGRKIYAPLKDVGDVMQSTVVPTPADVESQIVPKPLV
jgi:hypothetical protein